MNCPKCGSLDILVTDSRPIDDGQGIRRRRLCRDCSHRFTSYEYLEGAAFRVFAAELRAVIDRHEGGVVPNPKRRAATATDAVEPITPAMIVPVIPTPSAVPVRSLKDRLKERRQER